VKTGDVRCPLPVNIYHEYLNLAEVSNQKDAAVHTQACCLLTCPNDLCLQEAFCCLSQFSLDCKRDSSQALHFSVFVWF